MVKNIQALRGVAVILVLVAHLTKIEEKYFTGFRLLPEFLSIGISGVDLFFVISGFVMIYVTRNAGRSIAALKEFLAHRLTRIYPLYWFYSLLVLIVFILRPTWVNSAQGNQVNLLASFLLLPLPAGQFPLLGVGWSLIHEMYFYLVFGVLLFLPRRIRAHSLILWFGLVIGGMALGPNPGNATIQLIAHPLTLEFIAGSAIGLLYLAGRGRLSVFATLSALVIWCVAYTLYAQQAGHGMAAVEWRRPLVFGIPAALMCYGLVILERDKGIILPIWLIRIGDWSYSIYLSHLLMISALGRLWHVIGLSSLLGNMLALIGIFLAAIFTGKLSYALIEKPIQKYIRRTILDKPWVTR